MEMSTDDDWQILGKRDPYFAVLTEERFRRDQLTNESLDAFFQTGRDEAHSLLSDCERHLGSVPTRSVLEFGCGVGRLLIPMSGVFGQCVGVDVSDAMREEAANNCSRFNRANVDLMRSIDELGNSDKFSLIYSYTVLQHIDSRRGLEIITDLLGRLDEGGCAALHVTFAHSKHNRTRGVIPITRAIFNRLRRPLSRWSRRVRGREPKMQMNAYPLNEVFFIAQELGVRSGGFRYTNHYGHLGLLLFLKRE
jgi:SAM-dependent methyltransferase